MAERSKVLVHVLSSAKGREFKSRSPRRKLGSKTNVSGSEKWLQLSPDNQKNIKEPGQKKTNFQNKFISERKIRGGRNLRRALHLLQHRPVEVLHHDTRQVGQRQKRPRKESHRNRTHAWGR